MSSLNALLAVPLVDPTRQSYFSRAKLGISLMHRKQHSCSHLTESLGGGVLTAIKAICDAQASIGYATELVYLERLDTPTPEQIQAMFPNSQIIKLGKSNFTGKCKLFFYSWKILFALEPQQIIHVHSTIAGTIIRIPNLLLKKVIHYTPHCYAFQRKDIGLFKKTIYRFIEGGLTRFTPTIVLGCSHAETNIAHLIGAKKSKYLGNFVALPAIEYSSDDRVDSLQVIVGTVGRITRQKNLPRYVDLIQNLGIPIRFNWIGGNEKKEWDLGNERYMNFSGWLSPQETRAELKKIDVFMLLSDWEGLPFVALEAMALGKPVILWNFDSASELVTNGLEGYVVNSVEATLSALSELLSSPEKRRLMGAAGQKLMRTNFNLTSLPAILSNIYDCCDDAQK